MNQALVNINGQITDSASAKISVFDRGFLYGDSVYEVIRTYRGKFFAMDEHLRRLSQSAELLHMKISQPKEELQNECERTLAAFRSAHPESEAYCRIIVTRGVGKIGFSRSCIETPTQIIVIVQPIESPSQATREKGIALKIVDRLRNDRRALDPAMKSGNYLNSVLAFLEAQDEGFDDAVLCDATGHITEGTTFNLFYVKNGELATSPLDVGILDGITRRFVMKIARDLKIPVVETRFSKQHLYEADEVFITGSVKEVLAVTRLDHLKIGDGKPGPITRKLALEFDRLASEGTQR